MEAPAPTRRTRFGAFEVDTRAGEVYTHGIRLKLQDQPFQVLAHLLQHPDEVVTREELRQKLWPADTFVDFDTGLNSAIKKLRDVLVGRTRNNMSRSRNSAWRRPTRNKATPKRAAKRTMIFSLLGRTRTRTSRYSAKPKPSTRSCSEPL